MRFQTKIWVYKFLNKRLLTFGFGFICALMFLNHMSTHSAYAITGPSLVWSKSITGHIVQSSPAAVDLNGDGVKDIIVGAWDGKVYALSGRDGTLISGWPVQTEKAIDSSPAVITQNGQTQIYIGSGQPTSTCAGGGLYSFNADGTQRFHFLPYDQVSNGGSAPCYDLAVHSSPAIADLNFDGNPDVVFGPLGVNTFLLNSDSSLGYGWPFHWDDTQFASPALGDLTHDGRVDIVEGGDASPGGVVNFRGGLVRALMGLGHELWEYRIGEQVYSSPVIGDVTGDGEPDVVFGAGNYYANNGGSTDSNKIFVLNRFGQLICSKDLGAQTLASPTLADLNGDGVLDIAIGTWNGALAGQIYALDGHCNNLPGYPRASGGNLVIGQITTADLTGDGSQDIITTTGGGVYAYSGKTGALLFTIKNYGSFQNSAYVGDIDNNGKLDIIIAGSPDNSTGVVERYEMPSGSAAVLGTKGWPKFRLNDQQTGSLLAAPLSNASALSLKSQLTNDQTLQIDDTLVSPNGQTLMKIGPDGNLDVYHYLNQLPWSSNTAGSVTKQLILQTDGNLVLYNSANNPIWNSQTGGNPGDRLVVQNDGNVVIYSSGNSVLWTSGSSDPNWQSHVNDTQYGGNLETFQSLTSADGRFHLMNQQDGNVVLYSPNRALWQSGTSAKPLSRMTLQSDGNLVVYGVNNQPLWWSGTNQRDRLVLQNDGNLVLYNGLNQALWNSGTGGEL